MNLKCMMLTEKSQIQNGIYYMIPLTGHSQKDKTTGIKKKTDQRDCGAAEGMNSSPSFYK